MHDSCFLSEEICLTRWFFLPIESGLPFSALDMSRAGRGIGLVFDRDRALAWLNERQRFTDNLRLIND